MISRPIKEGFRGVGRHWGMSLSAAVAVTITLIMVSIFLVFSYNLQSFTRDIESSLEISVTVDYDYEGQDQLDRIESSLKAIKGVDTVTFSDKDAEFDYFLNSFDDETTRAAFEPFKGDENPMMDAFYIEAKSGDVIESIATKAKEIEGVSEVSYGGQSTLDLVGAMNSIRRVGAVIVIAMMLLAVMLIQNAIKLTISSRKDEITIMRNVGATNGFIRSPFLIEGMITGALGSIIPVALTVAVYQYLYRLTGGHMITSLFSLVKPNPFIYQVSGILVIIGIVVGLIGSWISVTKYLRWKR